VRDAFRAYRYHKGQTPKELGIKQKDIAAIENGLYVSLDKVLATIKVAWGFHSIDELLKAAEELQGHPTAGKKKGSATWTERIDGESVTRKITDEKKYAGR